MLIVDMPMPQMCPCELATEIEGSFYTCFAYYGVVERAVEFDKCVRDGKRPSWCPIKGVLPEEHGDLIDRDEVKKEIMKRMPRGCMSGSSDREGIVCTRRMMLYPISHAKVIVAAERKDDERTDKA